MRRRSPVPGSRLRKQGGTAVHCREAEWEKEGNYRGTERDEEENKERE